MTQQTLVVMSKARSSMDAGTTAQDAYQQILREHVAPALRELGFRAAPSRGNFRYETATHASEVRFQKSRYSSRQRVNFWVLLHAVHVKTAWVYWGRTLQGLVRDGVRLRRLDRPCR